MTLMLEPWMDSYGHLLEVKVIYWSWAWEYWGEEQEVAGHSSLKLTSPSGNCQPHSPPPGLLLREGRAWGELQRPASLPLPRLTPLSLLEG